MRHATSWISFAMALSILVSPAWSKELTVKLGSFLNPQLISEDLAALDLLNERIQVRPVGRGPDGKPLRYESDGGDIEKKLKSGNLKGGKAVIHYPSDLTYFEISIYDADGILQKYFSVQTALAHESATSSTASGTPPPAQSPVTVAEVPAQTSYMEIPAIPANAAASAAVVPPAVREQPVQINPVVPTDGRTLLAPETALPSVASVPHAEAMPRTPAARHPQPLVPYQPVTQSPPSVAQLPVSEPLADAAPRVVMPPSPVAASASAPIHPAKPRVTRTGDETMDIGSDAADWAKEQDRLETLHQVELANKRLNDYDHQTTAVPLLKEPKASPRSAVADKSRWKRDVNNPEAGVAISLIKSSGPIYGRHREFERRLVIGKNPKSQVKGYDFYVDETDRKNERHYLYYYKKGAKPQMVAVEKHDHVTFLSNYDVDQDFDGKITYN